MYYRVTISDAVKILLDMAFHSYSTNNSAMKENLSGLQSSGLLFCAVLWLYASVLEEHAPQS
jgi:hypothetical protein